MPAPPPPAALCIAGPNASGKSALALALAQLVPAEIISVDSALVYRGMDIGTAKPTPPERAVAPHHLIDIRDPRDAYSAADFARDATRLIADIRARGRLPVLVGGTMLYFKALLGGLHDMPPADAQVREAIDARARAQGWPALHAELARIDPATAARLSTADSQRIQRALEVWQLTGRPLSAFHADQRAAPATLELPLFSLEPADRAWLHARIAQRFDAMLADGLIDEVQALRARGDLHPDLPSMRCVGYRQVWDTLDGRAPMATLRERGIAATRQLAKRQLTWLRGMPARHMLPADDATGPDTLARQLLYGVWKDTF
ncbi:MAG: tRNA (adenosine(37)-N6)-dimethylallyltransferase MiaA [Pseudomonadota bacterium]|nr:tRNA (adenosine(37)-N6)-dimethylallyltransferase MiaA [Pseudomonadota bacterium]